MIINIQCPQCKTNGGLSLLDPNYTGPYKCWKCRALFTITMKNNEVVSMVPLSQEELDRQLELKGLKDKFKKGYM